MTHASTAHFLPPRQRLSCAHAVWTRRQMLFVLPQHLDTVLASKIYLGLDGLISLYLEAEPEALAEIRSALNELKPASLRMTVTTSVPEGVLVPSERGAQDEAWCVDEPMSLPQLNQLLSLVDSSVAEGTLDWREDMGYCFISPSLLDKEQMARVGDAAAAIGIVVDAFIHDERGASPLFGKLATRRQFRRGSGIDLDQHVNVVKMKCCESHAFNPQRNWLDDASRGRARSGQDDVERRFRVLIF